jgi:hypothetical protein
MVNIAKGAGEPGDTVGGAIFQTAGTYAGSVPRRAAPGLCLNVAPPKQRGRRESRVSDAPAAPRAKVESTWVGTTGSPVQTGFPCAMVLTASFVLPGDRALLPPSPRRLTASLARLGRDLPPQDLTPASGRQDHTTSPSATTSFVCAPVDRSRAQRTALQPRLRADAAASTASRPTSVTIASRPSCGRDGRILSGDLPDGLSGIFFELGLDRNLLICPSGSLRITAHRRRQ